MVLIKGSDIPTYLQKSAFYESLDEDDETEFEIPDDCFKIDEQVYSEADLRCLLRTARFWGLNDVPTLIAPFVLHNSLENSVQIELNESFPEYQRTLNNLLRVKESKASLVTSVAIECGFGISMVKYLYEHEGFALSADACTVAACLNDVTLLKYMHEQNCPWDERTALTAILNKRTDVLHYAWANDCPFPNDAMQKAARTGGVDVMICLHSLGFPYPAVVYQDVYHFASIQHLHSMGCAWNINSCEEYATRGDVACLKYAHENGCPWDELVCAAAARYGQLNCLQYAHEQGCPWNAQTTLDAAHFGEYECLKYAHQQGCRVTFLAANQACAFGQWRCLAYILCHCSLLVTFGVIMFFIFAVLNALWLHIMIVMKSERNLNDYANTISNLSWLMQFALFIYGPRCLSRDISLQLKLHYVLVAVTLVAIFASLISNPAFTDHVKSYALLKFLCFLQ